MKKRLAFIIDSIDRVFPSGALKGGGNLVAQKLILEFAQKDDIELHIISGATSCCSIDGVSNLHILESSPWVDNNLFLSQVKETISNQFDYVLFLNLVSPFENVLVQAFSNIYKYNNYNPFLSFFMKYIYGRKKIARIKSMFSKENKKYFVVSQKLKYDCVKNFGVPEEKITVVYPGVEILDFEKKENEIFTFGIASGTSQNKGVLDTFLAAFLLKLSGHKFKIKAILSTPQKNKPLILIINLLRLHNYIDILERQKDMKEFYSSIDCALMPSFSETFGLITTEAASFKVPCIMSNTIGATEIFTDNLNSIHFNKKVFPVFNLFLKMKKMLELKKDNNKFNELQENAFEIAKKYSWKSFADIIHTKILEDIK